jgi:hypothetical protein
VLFSTDIPHDRERENSFVELAELISTEMYYANRFQADILKHVNLNGKECDKFIFFPLIKHDETSNKGMMITSMTLKESLGLIKKEDNGMLSLDPNALK